MSLTPAAAAALRAELLARVAVDQQARLAMPVNPTREQVAALHAIDRANTARMRQIITDRVRMFRGELQLYGTQYRYSADSGLELYQVEDPQLLDERRASVGLGPHAEYDAQMRA